MEEEEGLQTTPIGAQAAQISGHETNTRHYVCNEYHVYYFYLVTKHKACTAVQKETTETVQKLEDNKFLIEMTKDSLIFQCIPLQSLASLVTKAIVIKMHY